MPVLTSYFPAGTSFKSVNHFAQSIINGGTFREYDYGKIKNYAKYNAETPPDYPVWTIELPVFLFIGKQDFLATRPVSINKKKWPFIQMTINNKYLISPA